MNKNTNGQWQLWDIIIIVDNAPFFPVAAVILVLATIVLFLIGAKYTEISTSVVPRIIKFLLHQWGLTAESTLNVAHNTKKEHNNTTEHGNGNKTDVHESLMTWQ